MNCTSKKMLARESQYPIVPANQTLHSSTTHPPEVPPKRRGTISNKKFSIVPMNQKQQVPTAQYPMVPVNQTRRSPTKRFPLVPLKKKRFALARKEYAIIPTDQKSRKAIVIPRGAIFGIIPILLSIFSVLSLVSGAWWYASNASASESELVSQFDCSTVNGVSAAECDALVSLIRTNDSSGWLQGMGWLSNTTPCQWDGVVCANGRVVELNLRFKRLGGTLSSDVGNLAHLTKLDLFGNQLNGAIPSSIGQLSNLTHLFLHANQLSGAMPAQIGDLSNLEELWLHGNQLSGSIPTSMGRLSSLKHLRLNSNQLQGSIPSELGSLRDLSVLWLSDNPELGGSLPSTFLSLPDLSYLYIFSTNVCQPTNSDFQSWTNGLQSFLSDEITCLAVQEEVTEVLSADPVVDLNESPSAEPIVEESASQEQNTPDAPAAPVVPIAETETTPDIVPVAAGNIQLSEMMFIPLVGNPPAHQMLANAEQSEQAGTQYMPEALAASTDAPVLTQTMFIPVVMNN